MSHSQQMGAKICKFELSEHGNIYVCPREEFCCNIGCCISPTFQFYQLWYYWFMVFFMFLVCSGGQWWYRYVIQGRCASAIAPPVRRTSYPRQARVAYTPARDTVVLHHLWKPSYPGINGPPPSYSQSGTISLGGPKPSPYMQLYGPPPSYESIIGSGPAPVHHGSEVSGGPSQNQTSGQQGRSSASHHFQPLDIHWVSPTVAPDLSTQDPSSADQEAPRQHTSVPIVQDQLSPHPAPQQPASSVMNPSQIP